MERETELLSEYDPNKRTFTSRRRSATLQIGGMQVARNDLDVRAAALAVRHMGPITGYIGPNDR